ncbi:four-carbon acid sugar kinase family protein [Salisediminibacterium beveridgei]|uniref:Four-carbon acid sugar kinase family protein n=1 Tax=Salisediminibacterium beveridgei TaxID=632773 RepID=A0A1D7QRC4_9BACI|nr:four-carbon acid sugar kinase family protein [Salisediminibacterium beveridgei]AOM81530.1 hypothetical protein BBEV_0135 [Salisediminibacterium beveridgei]
MKVGIIADDLTGANATGVKLLDIGFRAVTYLQGSKINLNHKKSSACVVTDSRYSNPEEAKKRVDEAYRSLTTWGADVITKRIDSTFRGNIGYELESLLNAAGENSYVILSPSFPGSGRRTENGVMYVNDVLLENTDVAYDPIHPLKTSYIPDLLKSQTSLPVDLVSIESVKGGSDTVLHELTKKIKEGSKIIICDGNHDQDIEVLADAVKRLENQQIVIADPGPLTLNYLLAKSAQDQYEQQKKWIISVGSVTTVTKSQIDYLVHEKKIRIIHINANCLVEQTKRQDEMNRTVNAACESLETENVVIVSTSNSELNLIDIGKAASDEKVSEDVIAKRLTDGLAGITNRIIERTPSVAGSFFCGGDVLASFCEETGAQGIELFGEVMPLIAHGKLLGGERKGLDVITKGGMIGGKNAIQESLAYLQNISMRSGSL